MYYKRNFEGVYYKVNKKQFVDEHNVLIHGEIFKYYFDLKKIIKMK